MSFMNKHLSHKLNAAVIGLGVGKHHAYHIQSDNRCNLLWICDFDKSKLDEAEKEFPKSNKSVDFNVIVNDPDVDLVSIASYDEYHKKQVIASIENSKHVFVEKPMCLNHEEAVAIKNVLKIKPCVKLSSNLVLRTCPLFKNVRNEVITGNAGKVYHIEADYFWGRPHKLLSGWRSEADYYSIILGAAIHMVDLVCWIKGQKPYTIQAFGSRIIADGSKQRHNDFSVITMKFKDDSTAKVSAHGGCMHPHFHSLNVFGEKKSFLHSLTGSVWVDSNDQNCDFKKEASEYPAKENRKEILLSFIDSILNNSKEIVSQDDVFTAMSVCLSAEKSIQQKEIIEIDYI